jgi:hypothetical protein
MGGQLPASLPAADRAAAHAAVLATLGAGHQFTQLYVVKDVLIKKQIIIRYVPGDSSADFGSLFWGEVKRDSGVEL